MIKRHHAALLAIFCGLNACTITTTSNEDDTESPNDKDGEGKDGGTPQPVDEPGSPDSGQPNTGEVDDAGVAPNDAGGGETDETDEGDSGDSSGDAGAVALPELSNIDLDDLPALPEGDFRISGDCDIDTDTGMLGCRGGGKEGSFNFAVVEPEGGSRLAVMRVNSIQIDMGGTLAVSGGLPLILVASQSVRIFGTLSTRASGANAVGGGFGSGQGLGAGTEGVDRPDGGGSYCGVGGVGATADGTNLVPAGPTYGTETLIPLLGGSGGGGPGGAGGGALQIVAGSLIQVGLTGVINAGGGGGKNGGGGGGSGGAILLEAPEVTIEGNVAANGGGGGISSGGNGGFDANGNSTPARSEKGINGGFGSAGDDPNGQDGVYDTTNSTPGGGGGAGRIRINTADGTAAISGTVSPSEATSCVTFGTLL